MSATATPLAGELEAFIDKQNFRFFRGRELTPYWTQVRKGVTNSVPPRELWPNILPTLRVLDEFRAQHGGAVVITSSYRSPEYNRAVGGEDLSYHMRFQAIDFQSPKGYPGEWAVMLRGLRGRGYFSGGVGKYATFVHVDTRGHNADW